MSFRRHFPRIGHVLSLRSCALLLVCVALGGCPSTGTARPDSAGLAKATRYVKQNRHADAAPIFERLARTARGEQRDALLLDASRAWVEAGQLPRALAAIDRVDGELPANDTGINMLAGFRLLRDDKPQQALAHLSALRKTLPSRYLGLWYELRGRAFFQSGDPVAGVGALVERELWLRNGDDIRANRDLIWRALRAFAKQGDPLAIPAQADPITAGWMALSAADAMGALDPYGRAGALRNWLAEHPDHPGVYIVEQFNENAPAELRYPNTIAVLLPSSGRFAGTSAAVRDGFMAAYIEDQARINRPAIRFYDTGSQDLDAVVDRALADGAGFIVGPLLKEKVEAVAQMPVTAPVLALNTLPETAAGKSALFQFSLAPEHEAAAVARRAVSEGMSRAVALVPNSAWGERLLMAFSDELQSLGGQVLSYQTYEGGDSDFAGPITQLLNLNESRERNRQISAATGVAYEFQPRRRQDAQFVFVASDDRQGRLIRPAFLYHFAEDMPVFATAAIFSDDAKANGRDLDGLVFADMPWVISPDDKTLSVQRAFARHWPSRVQRRGRLYAMGYDAYRLIPALLETDPLIDPWPGVTGRLSMGAGGQIRRDLDVAVIRSGQAQPLGRIDELALDENDLLDLEAEREIEPE